MITFIAEELAHCLIDTKTKKEVKTEAKKIARRSELRGYNSRTGWHVNWSRFGKDVDIYALYVKGNPAAQGLIALQDDPENRAVHMIWACTAPHNNIYEYGMQRYKGVGGHLFAIAAKISLERGYEGYLYGEPADEYLFHYYCDKFGANPLPPINTAYRVMFSEAMSRKIIEVYDYEWSQ